MLWALVPWFDLSFAAIPEAFEDKDTLPSV